MRRKRILALLALSLLVGCIHPSDSYVEADRATRDAIAPEYLRYVEADETLDEHQKARRVRTVEAWDLRIEAASN